MECTVLIPTYNRPNHLKRILSYYNQYGNDLPIVIADSSSEANKKLNRETVSSFHNTCFSYLDKYDPSINPVHKILDALQQVSTKYCVPCADDDFVTPVGIQEAIDFLENTPDYSAAYGNHVTFQLDPVAGGEPKIRLKKYKSQSNVHDESKERLIYEVANNYNTSFYAVNRTDFRKMVFTEAAKISSDLHIADSLRLTSDALFAELVIVWLPAIYGKMKCLDTLFCAREDCTPAHLRRTYVTLHDLTVERIYRDKRQECLDCLASHLSAQSGISILEANQIVDKAISIFEKKSDPFMQKFGRIMTDLNLPDWLDHGVRKLYRFTASGFLSREGSDYAVNSKEFNECNQIRLCVLSNAIRVYGLNP